MKIIYLRQSNEIFVRKIPFDKINEAQDTNSRNQNGNCGKTLS